MIQYESTHTAVTWILPQPKATGHVRVLHVYVCAVGFLEYIPVHCTRLHITLSVCSHVSVPCARVGEGLGICVPVCDEFAVIAISSHPTTPPLMQVINSHLCVFPIQLTPPSYKYTTRQQTNQPARSADKPVRKERKESARYGTYIPARKPACKYSFEPQTFLPVSFSFTLYLQAFSRATACTIHTYHTVYYYYQNLDQIFGLL